MKKDNSDMHSFGQEHGSRGAIGKGDTSMRFNPDMPEGSDKSGALTEPKGDFPQYKPQEEKKMRFKPMKMS